MYIEKEAKKIEKLNHLYKMKVNGELFEKSNIESVLTRLENVADSIKVRPQYMNDEVLTESIVSIAKEQYKSKDDKNEKSEARPDPIKSNDKKVSKTKVILSTKKVYKSFIKQDLDLASFLKQKDFH
jgi:hypothetical protein